MTVLGLPLVFFIPGCFLALWLYIFIGTLCFPLFESRKYFAFDGETAAAASVFWIVVLPVSLLVLSAVKLSKFSLNSLNNYQERKQLRSRLPQAKALKE